MRLIASMLAATALLVGCGGEELAPESQQEAPVAPASQNDGEGTVSAMAGPYYYATAADNGKRLMVCADSLTVRRPNGSTCTIGYPQTFTVYSGGSEWVSGHGWGGCGVDGVVQNGWFCWP
ncbi:hypothetical protein [Myxococcus hansupus]|uniref:hypothetical protein n=1 Tax=Pseudomyxococcus hansupus TaxID=1297742 RepID=UPI00027297BA|nr:hypothetical protein [Myxococcus hansupus]